MEDFKKGDILEVELQYITQDGRGVYIDPHNTLFLVRRVRDTDVQLKVEVTDVFEQTVHTKRISSVKTAVEEAPGKDTDNPYQLDDEEPYGEEPEE
jgi:hypothetical protein